MNINPGFQIERLLQYGVQKGLLGEMDVIDARNRLLDLYHLEQPFSGAIPAEHEELAVGILSLLVDNAAENSLLGGDTSAHRVLFDNRIMGCLMPRPSELAARFGAICDARGIQAATDYFYQLSIDSNYIRMAEIRRNLTWTTETAYGPVEITINLTKPEKDPRQIALDSKKNQGGYPRCQLCVENVGYAGRTDFPARQTLRLIPLEIHGERWYFQYSPYVYFQEHSIVLSGRHEPMAMNSGIFEGLLDFVDQFPHYFCGSNTELPIVGGSILSHEHFQSGRHVFPIHKAGALRQFAWAGGKDLEITILRWPLSTIRVTSRSRRELAALTSEILQTWRGYSDPGAGIVARSGDEDGKMPAQHNTVTPIARKTPDDRYEMVIILRNNRTSAEFPDGIFHPHPEIHPIKKENIGLIEAMGLAILPGRLKREMAAIQAVMEGRKPAGSVLDEIDRTRPGHTAHADWIGSLFEKHGCGCSNGINYSSEEAAKILRDAVGRRFTEGLEHCGVFKQDNAGIEAFCRFMAAAGCRPAKPSGD